MTPKHEDSKFKKWLDILQQESWQLELIISGVAIFGLIQAFDPVIIAMNRFQSLSIDGFLVRTVFTLGFLAVITSLFALTLCLIIHIVLRGLWIGAVGLRYFSGDIDYDHLKYTDKFKNYLKKRIGSFDDYIRKLEDYCSIIFAISFLLVFFFIAFFLSLVFFNLIFYVVDISIGNTFVEPVLGPVIAILFVTAYLFTAIDFFTQGFFKKKKWLGWIYFPIYRVMSRVTFSFVYRPLLYNLLDNKLGKRILALLIPLFLLIVIGFQATDIIESNYHNSNWNHKASFANDRSYQDQLDDKKYVYSSKVIIPSKIIHTTALPVFIKHTISIENAIYHKDSTLIPKNDLRGLDIFSTDFFRVILANDTEEADITDEEFDRYSKLLGDVITLKIDDTLSYKTPYIFGTSARGQTGYESVLDVKDLTRGLHILKVENFHVRYDSLQTRTLARIPFWYYPD